MAFFGTWIPDIWNPMTLAPNALDSELDHKLDQVFENWRSQWHNTSIYHGCMSHIRYLPASCVNIDIGANKQVRRAYDAFTCHGAFHAPYLYIIEMIDLRHWEMDKKVVSRRAAKLERCHCARCNHFIQDYIIPCGNDSLVIYNFCYKLYHITHFVP
jgi:hypothetical protein